MANPSSQPILMYALGGGLGHVQRSLAFARMAARAGHPVTVFANSALAQRMFPHGAPIEGVHLALHREADTPERAGRMVKSLLHAKPWSALVVDTFPRGLGGELIHLLPGLALKKFWTHRDLNPAYARRYDLAAAAELYDLILVPGEGEGEAFASHPSARTTRPWLLREAGEWLSREEARRRLGIANDDTRPLVVLVGGGHEQEIYELTVMAQEVSARAPELHVKLIAPPDPDDQSAAPYWPLLEVLPGVDLLVGGGGYNTVHEARATGTPLLAFARKRLYDRQARRLREDEVFQAPEDILPRMREVLSRPRPPARPDLATGAREAWAHVAAMLK